MCGIEGCGNSSEYGVMVGPKELSLCPGHVISTAERFVEQQFDGMDDELVVKKT